MRIEYLETFVDLSETLNFRQTAENKNLTQSGVSQTIKSLESELGFALFNRTKRQVKLTDGGNAFYKEMKLLLKKFNSSVERAREIADRENNTFTIGFTGTIFETTLVPEIISKFNQLFPNIQLYLVNFNHNILKEELLSKSCDVIFQTYDSVETLPDVQFTPLTNGSFVCVVPANHPFAGKSEITFADLEQANIILFNASQCPPKQAEIQQLLQKKCAKAMFCYSDSIMLSYTMVQGGLGISVMPDFVTNIANHNQYESLAFVPLDYNVDLTYGIVSLNNSDKELIRSFTACAQSMIGS